MNKSLFWTISAVIAAAFFLSACAGNMSLQDARQVAVSMNDSSFVPPPRRIDDITTAFDQYHTDPETTRQLMAQASSSPPADASQKKLLEFYYRRGLAAQKLGYLEQSLEDFRKAMSFMDQSGDKDRIKRDLFIDLASMEFCFFNIINSEKIAEQGRRTMPTWVGVDVYRTVAFANLGDIEEAEKARNQANYRMADWPTGSVWKLFNTSQMKAEILDAKGNYREAEIYHRNALRYAMSSTAKNSYPGVAVRARKDLAANLMIQGRLSEAEVEARQMLLETMDLYGKQSFRTLWRALILSGILVKQERFLDAEKLLTTIFQTLKSMQISDSSLIMCEVNQALGETLAGQGRWHESLKYLMAVRQKIEMNPAISNRYLAERTALFLSLIKTGQGAKALEMLSESYDMFRQDFGLDHPRTREAMGLLAVVYADLNRLQESLEYFSGAVPFLLKHGTENRTQLKFILEGYLSLLDRIKDSALAEQVGIDAVKESFRIANAAHLKSVHRAIAESAARMAMTDSELAGITREEQDANLQIDNLEAALAKHLTARKQQQSSGVVADLRQRIAELRRARQVLRDRIKTQFPQYTDLLHPQPPSVEEVRKYLRPDEVYVSIYAAAEQTYIWAVPSSGPIGYSVASLSEEVVRQKVAQLRKSLAPSPEVLGDIPEFDLGTAYGIYAELLKPVEATLKRARDLLVVAPGPLGPLPFSVLPTRPVKPGRTSRLMFAEYRQVPWLIRDVSITRLPGASAFMALRRLPGTDTDRQMFAGFGDPVFNPAQLDENAGETSADESIVTRGGIKVHVRGIRTTSQGSLDTENLVSGRLSHLNRLPDTAAEINSIARLLEADPQTDIFLGADASEGRIKTMDLSDRRVVVFASHALVPGDLDGLSQPALALSAPSVTGDQEDGILTMEEIMRLKLNADWVVLSACNTGAADGAGAEAVSGLGRAFFYAGSKAILVSMWPVETTSARKLTTGVFENQKQDVTLSRSRALQKAALDLMDTDGFKEASTGKIVASYAHPLFWAPFVIVGEGGQSIRLQ